MSFVACCVMFGVRCMSLVRCLVVCLLRDFRCVVVVVCCMWFVVGCLSVVRWLLCVVCCLVPGAV